MLLLVIHLGQVRPSSRPAIAESRPTSNPASPRIVDFGDGIKINYIERQIEVAGQVILREGPLELFAYAKAAAPKEHESIVLVWSKPERVFMALGLIGATPGKPLRWFHETETLRAATGDPIDVLVRYREGKKERVIQAVDWMLDASTRKPMPHTHWLFCGSERSESGEFAANMEGTLVTVVDFTTSVLGLPQQHSDADSELWLMANESAIPPTGTPVTIILRPMSTLIRLQISESGAIEMNGRSVPGGELIATVQRHTAGWMDRATVEITSSRPDPAARMAEEWERRLEGMGIEKTRITVLRGGGKPAGISMEPASKPSSKGL